MEDSELETKLGRITGNIVAKLKEGIMTEREYHITIFNQMKDEKMINGDYLEDKNLFYMDTLKALLREKNDIKYVNGLKQRYAILEDLFKAGKMPGTSKELLTDIKQFGETVDLVVSYLKEKIQEKDTYRFCELWNKAIEALEVFPFEEMHGVTKVRIKSEALGKFLIDSRSKIEDEEEVYRTIGAYMEIIGCERLKAEQGPENKGYDLRQLTKVVGKLINKT